MTSMLTTSPKIKYSGLSMWPSLKEGVQLTWQKLNDYQIGDVILFRENNEFVIHRIVQKENEYFITKGDRSLSLDHNKLNSSQILGKIEQTKSSKKVAIYSLKTINNNKLIRYFYLCRIYLALL